MHERTSSSARSTAQQLNTGALDCRCGVDDVGDGRLSMVRRGDADDRRETLHGPARLSPSRSRSTKSRRGGHAASGVVRCSRSMSDGDSSPISRRPTVSMCIRICGSCLRGLAQRRLQTSEKTVRAMGAAVLVGIREDASAVGGGTVGDVLRSKLRLQRQRPVVIADGRLPPCHASSSVLP